MWTRLVLVVSVALSSVTGVGASAAIEPGDPITVSPDEGGPFTVITVTGADCTDGPSPAVSGVLWGGPDVGAVASFSATPDPAGAWTASFTLPPNQPESAYEVVALCQTSPDAVEGVEYARHPFTFLEGEDATLTVSPTRAQTGSDVVVTASGTLCRGAAAGILLRASVHGTDEADEFVDQVNLTPAADGSWTGRLTIPNGPPATYDISAVCSVGDVPFFLYDAADVVVSAPTAPTAPPARPLPARPTFTG